MSVGLRAFRAMEFAHVNEHSIAYRDNGAGPPIVLLHGWPLDSREFVRQLADLSDCNRVIAWDAPGAGASSDPTNDATLESWADWLAGFLDALALDSAHVGGLSWGGGLALAFANRYPNRVRSLILMSAYAGWGGSLHPDETRRRLEVTRSNMRQQPNDWVPSMIATLLPPGAPVRLEEELTVMLSDCHPEATLTALHAFAQADLRPALSRVRAPTLMIYGDRDIRAPRSVWEPIHHQIATSTMVLIPNVGHMVDMQAAERCNAVLRAFVADVDSGLSSGTAAGTAPL